MNPFANETIKYQKVDGFYSVQTHPDMANYNEIIIARNKMELYREDKF